MKARLARAAAVLLLVPGGLVTAIGDAPARRDFQFTYEAEIRDLPADARKVAIWLPYPVSDSNQDIRDIRVSAPHEIDLRKDPEYGNTIAYLALDRPDGKPIKVAMTMDVRRREHVNKPGSAASRSRDRDPDRALWLGPDHLVPLDRRIRALAAEVTRGKKRPIERARAIYDYVVSTMKYDKSGTGWGRGDIYWACDRKRGNCTDFHALFIGLCRAVGIPAKFAIGFPLPETRGEGEIPGYHCWAEFHLDGYGWIPVDTSEASKNPAKREYFFGAHDENRVQFTVGRDIRLNPPQAGDPVNFFIYPYVEVDGKPFDRLEKRFRFKDHSAAGG